MQPQELIEKCIRRGARLVRALTVAEGGLALALFIGGYLFLEIALDHVFTLSAGVRAAFLAVLAAAATAVATSMLILPLLRSISRLYVARRVETVFPHFKNSLTTFVELEKAGGDTAITRLVAHQAALNFQGVDVEAGLDSTRFVRLGYAFVVLVITVFLYSIVVPKSMWTSFMRAMHPWADIAAPTRIHIYDIKPGFAKVLLGSDVAISAGISGAVPAGVSLRWSRDGELWQSLPMQQGRERWHGTLEHVETNLLYYIRADDASSGKYTILTAVPPVAESLKVVLTPPAYTGLPVYETSGGNVTAVSGTQAVFTMTSNKDLVSALLKLSNQPPVRLKASGAVATGAFRIESSGRYSVVLTDSEGLSPAKPVEYDITAIPDRPPKVAAIGPDESQPVQPGQELAFEFQASDEYGLARLAFHFESDPSNANVRNYPVSAGAKDARVEETLTASALGARPGDTVSYYLEAIDNREAKPNVARTPTYTFRVAGGKTSVIAAETPSQSQDVPKTDSNLPGRQEKAAGVPSTREQRLGDTAASTASADTNPSAAAANELLKMMEEDRKAWEVIAKHMPSVRSPTGDQISESASKTVSENVQTAATEGAPSPGGESQSSQETRTGAGPAMPAGDKKPGEAQGVAASSNKGPVPEGDKAVQAQASESSAVPGESSGKSPQGQSSRQAPGPSQEGQQPPSTGSSEAGDSGPGEMPAGQRSETQPETGKNAQSSPPSTAQQPKGAEAQPSGRPATSEAGGAPSQTPQGSETTSEPPAAEAQPGKQPGAKTSESPGSQGTGEKPSQGTSSENRTSPAQSAGQTPPPEQSSGSQDGSQRSPGAADSAGAKQDTRTASGQRPGPTGGHGERPAVPEAPGPGEAGPLDRTAAGARSDSNARVFAARNLVSRLSADASTGRVSAALLEDLGWKPSELRTFVRKYEDVLADVKGAPFDGQITLETDLRPGEVLVGRRDSGVVGTVDTSGRTLDATSTPSSEVPREEVAPEYKRIVDEYYRSLAQAQK